MIDSRDVVLDQWGWPKEDGPPPQMTVPHGWTTDWTYGYQVCVRCGLATTVVPPAHEGVACLTPEERHTQQAEWNQRVNDTEAAEALVQWRKTAREALATAWKPLSERLTALMGDESVAVMTDPVTEGALCPATPDHREGRICVLCRGKGWIPFQD